MGVYRRVDIYFEDTEDQKGEKIGRGKSGRDEKVIRNEKVICEKNFPSLVGKR